MPRRSAAPGAWSRPSAPTGPAMPAPPAASTPIAKIRPAVRRHQRREAVPSATSSTPTNSTRPVPMRSATMPANGCVSPHHSWPNAKARLMLADAEPCDGVERADEQAHRSGARPWSARRCRPQPAAPSHQGGPGAASPARSGISHRNPPSGFVEHGRCIRRAARAAATTRASPEPLVERELRLLPCALRLRCASRGRRRWPRSRRLRASAPGPSSTQPGATSGCRLRVSVEASSCMRARQVARPEGPELDHVRQQRVLRGLQPGRRHLGVVVACHLRISWRSLRLVQPAA